MRDSNPRHPPCKGDATTAELITLAPPTGIEPVTPELTAPCSA